MSDWEELLVDRLANAGYLASAIDEDGDHVTLIDAPAGDVIRVVAEALLSDEAIERAARNRDVIAVGEDSGADPAWVVRTVIEAALTAALGEDESDE